MQKILYLRLIGQRKNAARIFQCLVVLGTYPVIIPLSGISLRAVRGLHRCESLLKLFCFVNKFVLWAFVYEQIPTIWCEREKTHFRGKKLWHVLLLPAGPSHAFYMMRRDPANQQAEERSPLFPQSVITPFKSEQPLVSVFAFKTHFRRAPLCRIHRVALRGCLQNAQQGKCSTSLHPLCQGWQLCLEDGECPAAQSPAPSSCRNRHLWNVELQRQRDAVTDNSKEGPYGRMAVLINISNVNSQGYNHTKLFVLFWIIASKL